MHRPAPRRVTIPYAVAATCAVIGVLLWVRDRTSSPPIHYGNYLAADGYTGSAWRVWSQAVPEERLGLYLIAAGLVLSLVTLLLSVRHR